MEETLDVQLFIRYPSKGIQLTAQGVKVLEEARILMRNVESFRAATSAVSSQLRGNLSIACFLNLGSNYLSEIIRSFEKKYPEINVFIHDLDQSAIFESLSSGMVEFALTFDLSIPESMQTTHIASRAPFAVLPADNPLALKDEVTLKDLAKYPFILMDLPHTNDYFLSLFEMQNVSPNIRYRTKLFETVRTFVASGLGVSISNLKPSSLTTYNGRDVVIKPFSEPLDPLNIVLIHYRRLKPRRIAEVFEEHVLDYFKTQ